MRIYLMLVLAAFVSGVPSALAQDAKLSEKQKTQLIKRFPKADANKDGKLDDAELRALQEFMQARRKNTNTTQTPNANPQSDADTDKWKTVGFKQGNTMGGGEAAIPKSGKFRVFVLMGQSNMTGAGRAAELKSPYTEKHDRIRVWANGRWEYFVPSNRFGPGVSLAHELADLWPNDTIGILKVSDGGTGVRAFEKNWTFERSNRTFDGKKGSFYKDLMNAVAAANEISQPEFSGFVWKQGGADGTKKDLGNEYYDTFKQLVSDLRIDLGAPSLPVFILATWSDAEWLEVLQSSLEEEDLLKAKQAAGKPPVNDADLLKAIVSYISDSDIGKKLLGKRLYILTVRMEQNRAGRDMPNVVTVHHGKLPVGADGIHLNAEGQTKLGKITASAIEKFYNSNATPDSNE